MQNEYEKQLEQLKNTVHIDEGNRLEDAKGTIGCGKLKKENSSPKNGLLLMRTPRASFRHCSPVHAKAAKARRSRFSEPVSGDRLAFAWI
ncbi:unnamed protein product [Sphagnum troendelagicum]